jgi:hypothetical protein
MEGRRRGRFDDAADDKEEEKDTMGKLKGVSQVEEAKGTESLTTTSSKASSGLFGDL